MTKPTVITLFNHAGGVGKTTASGSIAAMLAAMGHSTLAIDLDAQANLTQNLLEGVPERSIADYFKGAELPLYGVEIHLDIVPASPELVTIGDQLRENDIHKMLLDNLERPYQFVVIDTATDIDHLVINALAATDYLLVPVVPDVKSILGLAKVEAACQLAGRDKMIQGIFFSNYNPRRRMDRLMDARIRNTYGQIVFNSYIRQNNALRECTMYADSILEYAPSSNGAKDYHRLTVELLHRL